MNKIIIGNLKMNMVMEDLNQYIKGISFINNLNVIICPSSIFIPYFVNHNYSVGIQDISSEVKGAYTGEISAIEAKSIGVSYSLIGHTERRCHLNETNLMINNKVKRALEIGITPILCIGETKEEYEMMRTEQILKRQIVNGLLNINDINKVIIAYEPSWAVDTPKILSNKEIEEIINFIKNIVKLHYKCDNIRVVYGGGVNVSSIERLSTISNLDGFLIGKDALDAVKFKKIIEVIEM